MVRKLKPIGIQGSLQIPLLLAMFMIVMSGFGIWGFLRHWRFLMETQLRIDKCVGIAARDYRDVLNSVMAHNNQVHLLRAAILAAELSPELIAPLKVALAIVVAKQEFIRARWQVRRGRWLLTRGCGGSGDWALPLPALEFVRDAPDTTGPQALHWPGEFPAEFHLQIKHFPRYGAAQVEGGCLETKLDCKKWKTVWSPPRRDWASLY